MDVYCVFYKNADIMEPDELEMIASSQEYAQAWIKKQSDVTDYYVHEWRVEP